MPQRLSSPTTKPIAKPINELNSRACAASPSTAVQPVWNVPATQPEMQAQQRTELDVTETEALGRNPVGHPQHDTDAERGDEGRHDGAGPADGN